MLISILAWTLLYARGSAFSTLEAGEEDQPKGGDKKPIFGPKAGLSSTPQSSFSFLHMRLDIFIRQPKYSGRQFFGPLSLPTCAIINMCLSLTLQEKQRTHGVESIL